MTEIRLRNQLDELPRLERAIDAFAAEHGLDQGELKTLQLVLEELVTNVIRHAYDDDREHEIVVRLGREPPAGLAIGVEDAGRAFDPTTVPIPATGSSKGPRAIGGRGIGLVRRLVDEFHYERRAGRNLLSLRTRGGRPPARDGKG